MATEQGENAPISEAAAFAYTTALNRFLEKGSAHRVQIGDASTVFWADAADDEAAALAEDVFGGFIDAREIARNDEKVGAEKVARFWSDSTGQAAHGVSTRSATRRALLRVGPVAQRGALSVRFYVEDDFGKIAENLAGHVERMRIEPPPKKEGLSVWRLLIETAAQHKSENIPPQLAGDWLRAILTGAPYPLTLLSAVLMRLRADHDVNALRVSIVKAVLINNFKMKKEAPVALDQQRRSRLSAWQTVRCA